LGDQGDRGTNEAARIVRRRIPRIYVRETHWAAGSLRR
jgi:hypothetical protein